MTEDQQPQQQDPGNGAAMLNPQDIVLHEQSMIINSVQNVGGSIKMVEIVPNNTQFSNADEPVYTFDQNTLTFPIDTGRYAIVQSESYLELKVRLILDMNKIDGLVKSASTDCSELTDTVTFQQGTNKAVVHKQIYLNNNVWWMHYQPATNKNEDGTLTDYEDVNVAFATGPKNAMALLYQTEVDLGNLRYVEKDVYRHRGYESIFQSIGQENHTETWFSTGKDIKPDTNYPFFFTNSYSIPTSTGSKQVFNNCQVANTPLIGSDAGNCPLSNIDSVGCIVGVDTARNTYNIKTVTLRIPFQYISRALDPVNSNMIMINSIAGQQMKINITLNQSLGKIFGSEDFIVKTAEIGTTTLKSGIYNAVLKIATKESYNFNQSVAQLPTIMYQLLSEQRSVKPIAIKTDTQYNIINASHQSVNDIVFSIDPNDKNDPDSAHYHQISGFYPGFSSVQQINKLSLDQNVHQGFQFYEFQVEIGGTPVFEKPGIKNLQRFSEITKNSLKILTKNAKSAIISQKFALQLMYNNYIVFNTEFFRNAIDAQDILADGIDGTQTTAIDTKVKYYMTDDTFNSLIDTSSIVPNLECTVYYDDLIEFQPQMRNAIQREPQIQRPQ